MANRKMIDYRVRIQVAEDSPDGVLLDFLKHERHPSFSHKEMVLWALRGYWMAIAFRQCQELEDERISEAKILQLATDAIYQLKQQVTYIQTTFGIERGEEKDDAAAIYSSQALGKASIAVSEKMIENWDREKDLFDSRI